MDNEIEVVRPVTKIIEVVERGPQGVGPTPIPILLKFISASIDAINVSDDVDSPSFLTGMLVGDGSYGVSFIALDGSMRNITGRDLLQVFGTISFQPDRSGGGSTTLLYLWSERSMDGINWYQNPRSLRSIEIGSSGETFKTSISGVPDWLDTEYVRFRLATDAGADLILSPPSLITNGELIDGYSVVWELFELS